MNALNAQIYEISFKSRRTADRLLEMKIGDSYTLNEDAEGRAYDGPSTIRTPLRKGTVLTKVSEGRSGGHGYAPTYRVTPPSAA